MGNFQCIHCGKTREQETGGTCPVCGYQMFAYPYDRNLVLRSEIRRSLRALETPPIQLSDLFLYRIKNGKEIPKAADEKRFASSYPYSARRYAVSSFAEIGENVSITSRIA